MQGRSFVDVFVADFVTNGWERVTTCRKPIIAAVAGYALGGGCEMAMMCDTIIAAESARFGQPEINLGIIPGAGGTQRLTRFVGKAKAMDMILTGRMMDAAEAERSGLVSRVVANDKLVETAVKMAQQIAALSRPAVFAAKESVNRAYETTLAEGVRYRAPPLPRDVRHGGSERGHGRFHREAQAVLQEPVTTALAGRNLVRGTALDRRGAARYNRAFRDD